MIIFGYPGIGKTSLMESKEYKIHDTVDLDSYLFNSLGTDPYWYKLYTRVAEELSHQGLTVFVSTHEKVVRELKDSYEKMAIVCPDLSLKDDWIKRLDERRQKSRSMKDKLAYLRAKEHFDDDISSLFKVCEGSHVKMYAIDNINYDLKTILMDIWDEKR